MRKSQGLSCEQEASLLVFPPSPSLSPYGGTFPRCQLYHVRGEQAGAASYTAEKALERPQQTKAREGSGGVVVVVVVGFFR